MLESVLEPKNIVFPLFQTVCITLVISIETFTSLRRLDDVTLDKYYCN